MPFYGTDGWLPQGAVMRETLFPGIALDERSSISVPAAGFPAGALTAVSTHSISPILSTSWSPPVARGRQAVHGRPVVHGLLRWSVAGSLR